MQKWPHGFYYKACFSALTGYGHTSVFVILMTSYLLISTPQLKDPKCNFLEHLSTDCVQLFRKIVIDMVS